MNMLQINIMSGREDARLIEHIERLQQIKNRQDFGSGISESEQETLQLCWERLDHITKPGR